MLFPTPGQSHPFSSVQVTTIHPRTQYRRQPRVGYLSLPLCLLLSKHISILTQLLIYLLSPRRLWAQWGRNWGWFVSGFCVLCTGPGLSTSVDWMNKQQKGIAQVPSWTQKIKSLSVTGHRVNARDVPLPRESDPADLVPVTLSRGLENDPKGLIRPLSSTGKWWDFKGADKRSWIFLPQTLGL